MTFEIIVGIATIVSAIFGVLSYRLLHREGSRENLGEQQGQDLLSPVGENTKVFDAGGTQTVLPDYGGQANFSDKGDSERYSSWVILDNGTAVDTENGLMWTQGPWGTVYNETRFVGKPVLFRWHEAAEEFGCALAIRRKDGNYGSLSEEDFEESRYEHGFERGKRVVKFAGFSDWRLPTAWEFRALINPNGEYAQWKSKVFPGACGTFWCANPKTEVSNFAKNIRRLLNSLKIANPSLENAWEFHLDSISGRYIDAYGGLNNQVLLVRAASTSDYRQ